MRTAEASQITSKQVYQILTCFDKIYFEMTDLEKKEFFRNFIDEIELYFERQSDGRIKKQINFNFPVYYNGNEGNAIRLPDEIQSRGEINHQNISGDILTNFKCQGERAHDVRGKSRINCT